MYSIGANIRSSEETQKLRVRGNNKPTRNNKGNAIQSRWTAEAFEFPVGIGRRGEKGGGDLTAKNKKAKITTIMISIIIETINGGVKKGSLCPQNALHSSRKPLKVI